MCNTGHRFIIHDERILQRLPSPSHYAFVLSHCSGLTSECLTLVVTLINEGKKISSIGHALLETRKESFYQNILCSVELQRVTNQGDTSRDIPKFEQSLNCVLHPGNKLFCCHHSYNTFGDTNFTSGNECTMLILMMIGFVVITPLNL